MDVKEKNRKFEEEGTGNKFNRPKCLPLNSRFLVVSNPIPLFAPVTITILLSIRVSLGHFGPRM